MENFIISLIIAATPLLLAAIGELVAERSGVLNLGVEGMMLMGAVVAFAVSHTGCVAVFCARRLPLSSPPMPSMRRPPSCCRSRKRSLRLWPRASMVGSCRGRIWRCLPRWPAIAVATAV